MNSSWMRWLGITAVNHIDHSRMYERLARRAGCGDRARASARFVTRLAQRAGCGDCARASARFVTRVPWVDAGVDPGRTRR